MSFLDMPQVDAQRVRRDRRSGAAARRTSSCRRRVENLSIAPSRIALAKLEAKLVGEMDAHFRLKDKLEPIREDVSRTSSSTARRRWAC